MTFHRRWGTGLVAFWVAALMGCVTSPVLPLTEASNGYAQEEDERNLIKRSNELDDELYRKGLRLTDDTVNTYVHSVGSQLVPPAALKTASFRFHVLRDPVVNAFALPNGSVYVTVGLLARLGNEAQLAHVLSHEIAHVVQRHGLLQNRSRKRTVVTAKIADIALLGTSIAYLPAYGVLAGNSRASELEADVLAIDYMARAGYPLQGAEQLFRELQEVRQQESVLGSVYSSHPDNLRRTERTRAVVSGRQVPLNGGRGDVVTEYRLIRARLVVENMRLKLNVRQYALALEAADRALMQDHDTAWVYYYRGEANRLMAEDPAGAAKEHAWIHGSDFDDALIEAFRKKKPDYLAAAKQSYRQALAADRGLGHAFRGFGLVAFAEGDKSVARDALKRYLESGRDLPDRLYINDILGRLDK